MKIVPDLIKYQDLLWLYGVSQKERTPLEIKY